MKQCVRLHSREGVFVCDALGSASDKIPKVTEVRVHKQKRFESLKTAETFIAGRFSEDKVNQSPLQNSKRLN